MILDKQYLNKNFETPETNNLLKLYSQNSMVLERNTKYHTFYNEEQKKKLLLSERILYLSSDILFIYLFVKALMTEPQFFKDYFAIPVILVVFFISWLVFQIIDLKSITYGSKENLIPEDKLVTTKEYLRYIETKVPLETMPDWFIGEEIIYTKDSFDTVLLALHQGKSKQLIDKYKKLFFKTNKIIDSNKKLLTVYLKEEKENLQKLKFSHENWQ